MQMKQKQLSDFPEYARIRQAVDRLRAEEQQIAARQEEIRAELNKPKRQIDGQDAWAFALQNEGEPSFNGDTQSSLGEEYQINEGRLRFIAEALATGEQELDKVHGRASLEICSEVRPQFVVQVRRVLEAIKAICEANRELEMLRSALQAQGVGTGSLPSGTFEIGGMWNDPYGGRIVGYQRYIAENYPELTVVAGQELAMKKREVDAKTQQFENREEA
jgi:hypothetical protein